MHLHTTQFYYCTQFTTHVTPQGVELILKSAKIGELGFTYIYFTKIIYYLDYFSICNPLHCETPKSNLEKNMY